MDGESESRWRELAEKHWAKPSQKVKKVRAEILKQEIWDALEKEDFDFRSLLVLDNVQLLEK